MEVEIKKKYDIKDIVNKEAEFFKEKDYNYFKSIIENNHVYEKDIKSKKYIFEIRALQINSTTISICVEGKKKNIFIIFGFAKYFAKTVDGKIIENTDEIVF